MGGRGWKRRGNPSLLSVYLEITLQIIRDTFSKKCWGNIERNWTCYLEINLGKTVLSIIWEKIFRKIEGRNWSPILHWNYTRIYTVERDFEFFIRCDYLFFFSLFFFYTDIRCSAPALHSNPRYIEGVRARRNRLFLIPRANINYSTRSTAGI